jgi:hypothetical protein
VSGVLSHLRETSSYVLLQEFESSARVVRCKIVFVAILDSQALRRLHGHIKIIELQADIIY